MCGGVHAGRSMGCAVKLHIVPLIASEKGCIDSHRMVDGCNDVAVESTALAS